MRGAILTHVIWLVQLSLSTLIIENYDIIDSKFEPKRPIKYLVYISEMNMMPFYKYHQT